MAHQHFNTPSGPSRRRAINQSHQLSNNVSRRHVPPTSRDVAFQAALEPNRARNLLPPPSHSDGYSNPARLSSNLMNNVSVDRPRRRYQLEAPPTRSHLRHPQSSDHHHHRSESQPRPSNRPPAFQSHRYAQDHSRPGSSSNQYDRRGHREEMFPPQSSPRHLNHRSLNDPSTSRHASPVRPPHHPSSASNTRPGHRSSHHPMPFVPQPPIPLQLHRPAYLLADFFQNFSGRRDASLNNDDNGPSPLAPMDMLAFAWIMQRPDVLAVPSARHIQFDDLLDLLAQDEKPSVGLSDSDIQRLPTKTYRKTSKSKSADDKCVICLSKYKTGEIVKLLRCKHYFHSPCIDPWLKTSTQCPICRGTQVD